MSWLPASVPIIGYLVDPIDLYLATRYRRHPSLVLCAAHLILRLLQPLVEASPGPGLLRNVIGQVLLSLLGVSLDELRKVDEPDWASRYS